MGDQFLRRAIVDIFPKNIPGISIGNSGKPFDIRIQFRIQKNNEGNPNTATVSIYNLSPTTRGYLSSKDTVLRLSVGYLGLADKALPVPQLPNQIGHNSSVSTVFIGNITKVKHDKKKKHELAVVEKLENTDLISEIDVGDGDNQHRNATLDVGYAPNIQLTKILTDISDSMGLANGPQLNFPNKTFANGLSLTGLSKNHLDWICESFNLEWSIQDQSLQVITKTGMTNDSVILVSPTTGLLRTPNQTSYGVEFTTLINPHLRPGRGVQIQSQRINGIYKIRKVIHTGCNWDGNFESQCEATVAKTQS